MGPVRVKEISGDIDNLISSPVHDKSRILRDSRDDRGLQILLMRILHELLDVFRVNDNCHSLLRFGDSDLRAVETGVLLRYLIKVDIKTACKLSDRYGYSACTEIVALFDQMRCFASPEKPLKLSLSRSVTLLDLSTALLRRLFCMDLGRSCRTADTVAACPSAEKDDDIARIGILTDHSASRSRCDDRADFHTLCNVIRMIDFFYKPGCKTDLIAVGTVTVRSLANNLLLRQFALQSLALRSRRVRSTCHAHSLIYISTSGKRIADRTAEACGCTTERLDFRRMVVRLILEIDEPLFLHAVHIDRDHDGACVDLVGFFLIVQLALRLQLLDTERCQIPEGYIFVIASLIHFVAVREIHLKCILQRLSHIAFFEVDLFQLCLECRVTAMIGPVRIENTDLRDGRISLLLVPIVLADEQEVLICHGQIQRVVEYLKIIQRHGSEALEFNDICRFRIIRGQCFRFHLIGDAGVYRIDAVVLYFCKIFIGNITDDHICGSGVNSRRFLLIEETDALLGGVGSLIELSGQIFY